MKIRVIKFYQSIKCSTDNKNGEKSEFTFIDAEKDPYTLTLDPATDQICIVSNSTKEVTITGMNNVIYFKPYLH
jgi:hypothetical protein